MLFRSHPQFDARTGAGGGVCHGGIPRRSDDRFADSVLVHGGNCHSGLPVFEGRGRGVAFVFDVNRSMPEVRGEAMREPQRSSTGRIKLERGRILEGQDILKAPEVRRTVGNPAQYLAFERFIIVTGFDPM